MRVPFGWLVFSIGVGWLVGDPGLAVAGSTARQQTYRLTDVQVPIVAPTAARPSHPNVPFTASGIAKVPEIESWPKPLRLIDQIEALRPVPELGPWASETLQFIDELTTPGPDSRGRFATIQQLESQRRELPSIAARVRDSGTPSNERLRQSSEILRLGYRLERRLAIWSVVSRQSQSAGTRVTVQTNSTVAFQKISFPSLDPTWVKYLLLDECRAAFGSLNPDRDQQKKMARQVLARIYSPVLNPEQAKYIQNVFDPGVIALLKNRASGPTDAASLLKRLEQFESRPAARMASNLNDEYQNRLWSDDPADQAIARELDTHFRNANFRMAISEQLMNRMIPELPATEEPVREKIMGARITGRSQIANQINVRLVPDSKQVLLRLETEGHVRSNTVARTKAYRVLNVGEARVQVIKWLSISRHGINSAEKPFSSSSANQSVVGVESQLDGIPVLGWLARRLAVRKLQDQDAETDQLFRRKVARAAEVRVQQEVKTKLNEARRHAYTNLIQPMIELNLDPHAYQLSTTAHQAVVRYRLAGRDQLAAHTSRPRDDGSSLLSFQIHQSAINNSIARIGLNGEKFTTEQLIDHLRDVMGKQFTNDEDQDRRHPAEFAFAPYDPIRVEFVDDHVNIVLNLKSLKVGKKGKTWKYLTLTTSYRILSSGMKLKLVQDEEKTRVANKGKRLAFRDKAAIFTVMNVLFKSEYTFNALPQRISERLGTGVMEVSQLVISDGWLGVSLDDQQSAGGSVNAATKPTALHSRTIRRKMKMR